MVMSARIWVSSVQRYLEAEGGEQLGAPLLLLSVTFHLYHALTRYRCFTSSSLFFSYQFASLSLSLVLPFSVPSLPFWELSQCQCLGSKVRQDWPGSLRRCPGERRPRAGVAGTWRPLLSLGWRRGLELRCTVENQKGQSAQHTACEIGLNWRTLKHI